MSSGALKFNNVMCVGQSQLAINSGANEVELHFEISNSILYILSIH